MILHASFSDLYVGPVKCRTGKFCIIETSKGNMTSFTSLLLAGDSPGACNLMAPDQSEGGAAYQMFFRSG